MTPKNHKPSDDSKAFLDCLTDFLGNSEGQSKEEVIVELRKQGIEIDDMTSNIKAMINQKIGEMKRHWLINAPKLRDKLLKQMESYQPDIPADINKLKAKIEELMRAGKYREQAVVCFRNFNEMTDDDLRQLYADFLNLIQLQKDDSQDNE